ncbi:MAG TPA: hypothetical protein ENJ19_04025 [Gammaproteobacteria bacterium]|nr:hypothetical protein [Gammaproteobacteria bacterium]
MSMSPMTLRQYSSIAAAALLLILLAGCEKEIPVEQSIKEVSRLLEVRKQAIDNKDLDLYASIILPGYSASGIPFEAVVSDMERLFSSDEKIEFRYKRTRPSIKANSARVTQMIEYHFLPSGRSVKTRETLDLRRVDGKWYIASGIALGMGG